MKANAVKCQFLISTDEERNSSIGGKKTQKSKIEKLLGVAIDNKLSFTKHVYNVCDKGIQRLNALARLSSFMSLENGMLIMKAIVSSQFGHCPYIYNYIYRTIVQ